MSTNKTFKADKAFKGALTTIKNKSNEYNKKHIATILYIKIEPSDDSVIVYFSDGSISILSGDDSSLSSSVVSSVPSPSSPPTQEDISSKIDNLNAKMDDMMQTIKNPTTTNNNNNNSNNVTSNNNNT